MAIDVVIAAARDGLIVTGRRIAERRVAGLERGLRGIALGMQTIIGWTDEPGTGGAGEIKQRAGIGTGRRA
jgi:hypothetical protein